jgi:hypothetical protein
MLEIAKLDFNPAKVIAEGQGHTIMDALIVVTELA